MRLIIIDGIADVDSLIRTMREIGIDSSVAMFPTNNVRASNRINPKQITEAVVSEDAQVDATDAAQAMQLLEGHDNKSPLFDSIDARYSKSSSTKLALRYVMENPGATLREIANAHPDTYYQTFATTMSRIQNKGSVKVIKDIVDGKLCNRYYPKDHADVLCNSIPSQYV